MYHSKKFLKSTEELPEGEQFGLLLDRTNFYAEQGGQEYDTGRILIDGVAEVDVQNVQVYAGYVLHTGYMKYGSLSVGDEVICEYEELRRHPIRNNHTGTHILNYALREVLGNEVDQKGSLVAPEKLRFDFSHKSAISDADLQKVEDISTSYIRQNAEVYAQDVPLATARNIKGVRAVFGETYPDPVRVVSVGVPVEDLLQDVQSDKWEKVSIEFCGGTHVEKTGEIKELIVLEESGIAKGIRRIIAVTGQAAYDVQREAEEFSQRLDHLDKMPFGPDKEQLSKRTQVELNELSISAITKNKLRARYQKISGALLDAQKAAQKAQIKKVVDTVNENFKDKANAGTKHVVVKLPFPVSGKAVSEALKNISSKSKDKTVYIIGEDEAEGKVAHGCYVAEVSCFRDTQQD